MSKEEIKSGRMAINKKQDSAENRKLTREQLVAKFKSQRDRDSELITGIFQNLENRATNGSKGTLQFGYRAYDGDWEYYELHDGERYRLPRGVVRHLNTNCYYLEYQNLNLQDENTPGPIKTGMPSDGRLQKNSYQQARKVHRFAFHNLEYSQDDSDLKPSNIVEVSAVIL